MRTIYRDVDQLSASGVPVWADRGRLGGFQLQPGWRTQVAIFPLSDRNETSSDYEMDANLLQNGIITDMSIRYSDFAIGQSLKALAPNPRPNCAAPDAAPAPSATGKKP